MDELVKAIADRVGLPEDKAKAAAETAVNFIKNKLPAPIASQVDNAIKGGGSGIGDVAGKLGGMLGKER